MSETNSFAALERRCGPMKPVLDRFLAHPYFFHWHIAAYPGNTRLIESARHQIRQTENPVLYVASGSRTYELLPLGALPDTVLGDSPYLTNNSGIAIRLDRLLGRYEPKEVGPKSGVLDDGFETSYTKVQHDLARDIELGGYDAPVLQQIAEDPSVFMGACIAAYPGMSRKNVWHAIFKNDLQSHGLWQDGFATLKFADTKGQNIIDGFGDGYDFLTIRPAIDLYCGWLDFAPDLRKKELHRMVLCNFTTWPNPDGSMQGMIQRSIMRNFSLPITPAQSEFVEGVSALFPEPAVPPQNEIT